MNKKKNIAVHTMRKQVSKAVNMAVHNGYISTSVPSTTIKAGTKISGAKILCFGPDNILSYTPVGKGPIIITAQIRLEFSHKGVKLGIYLIEDADQCIEKNACLYDHIAGEIYHYSIPDDILVKVNECKAVHCTLPMNFGGTQSYGIGLVIGEASPSGGFIKRLWNGKGNDSISLDLEDITITELSE